MRDLQISLYRRAVLVQIAIERESPLRLTRKLVLFAIFCSPALYKMHVTGTEHMRSSVYSVQRFGVRPSVCLSVCPICLLQQRAAGLLLWRSRKY